MWAWVTAGWNWSDAAAHQMTRLSCAHSLYDYSHELPNRLADRLVDHSAAMGAHLLDRLDELADHPWVSNVRGRVLAAGFDIVADKVTGTHFPPERDIGQRIRRKAHERGLIVRAFDQDMFGFAPPLIVERAEIDDLIATMRAAIDAVRAEEDGIR